MFELENFAYIKKIEPFEWVMLGIYILIITIITFYIKHVNIKKNPLYRYYSWGVLAKIFSGVFFCMIYIYYYNGGDTVAYYETSRAMVNLGMKNPGELWTIMHSSGTVENYSFFDFTTGYPWKHMYNDNQTLFVTKLLVPILYICFKSYLVATVVLSFLSFFGTWKFFEMLCKMYPAQEKRIALGVLFIPSVLFWGSGILKDTFTFSAVCWFIVGLNGTMIVKKNRVKNAIIVVMALYVLLTIKPYILISLLPGAIVWVFYSRISKIKSTFLKFSSVPVIFISSFLIGYFILSLLGDSLGKFSIDKMLKTAAVTQNDLKQDYYHGNSFDIGTFDPTPAGVLAKAPIAIRVGLFQPFLWEARNPVMIISGLENSIYLFLTLLLLWRFIRDPGKFIRVLIDNPILIFLISYTIVFSGLVGLSTSNFGALVRFKIPFLPAFVCSLLILNYFLDPKNKNAMAKTNLSNPQP